MLCLAIYAKSRMNNLKKEKINYFVFGHRHLPMMLDLNGISAKYINLGDWIYYFTYGVFEKEFELKTFD